MMSGYHYRYKTCSFITPGMSDPHSQTIPGLTKSWRKEERTEQKLCSFHSSRWVFLDIINHHLRITTDLKDLLWGRRNRLCFCYKAKCRLEDLQHLQVYFTERSLELILLLRTSSSSSSSKTLLTFSSGVVGRPIARVSPGDLHKSCLDFDQLFSVTTSLNVWRPRNFTILHQTPSSSPSPSPQAKARAKWNSSDQDQLLQQKPAAGPASVQALVNTLNLQRHQVNILVSLQMTITSSQDFVTFVKTLSFIMKYQDI